MFGAPRIAWREHRDVTLRPHQSPMPARRSYRQACNSSVGVHDCAIRGSRTLPDAHTATSGVAEVTSGTAVASVAKASISAFVMDPLLRPLIIPTKDRAVAGNAVAQPPPDTSASRLSRAGSSRQHRLRRHLVWTERTLFPEVVLREGASAFGYFS